MDMISAAQILMFSGGCAILLSSSIGFMMLIPLQPWGRKWIKGINFRQIGAAHLDWIMLGLMQGLAVGLVLLFQLNPPYWSVVAMIAGAWINPLSYVFRAFGIDAFSFAGDRLQRAAAMVGGASATAIAVSWFVLLNAAWHSWI